jgi:hypothetical protein
MSNMDPIEKPGWRRAIYIFGMFRFKFNEIDGIKKACLKTYETKMI